MLFDFLKNKPKHAPLPSTPEGEIAYIIGDVHGCYDKLIQLLGNIESHASAHSIDEYFLIFLGDLMDRGPKSNHVIDFLMTYSAKGVEPVFLMGNHEEVYLDVLRGNHERLPSWFQFGGRECLRSYGIDNLGEIHMSPENLLSRSQANVPQSHIDFISAFKNYFVFGDYLCVHAGIRPGKPLSEQKSQDLFWIRDKFLNYTKPHDYKIVHGHTINEKATDFGNRIPIDTGGYQGGPLTALYLNGTDTSFISSETA